MAYEIVEDVAIDDLVNQLTARNLPECYRAAFVITALRGKKSVVPAPTPDPVADPTVAAAPVTITAALTEQQP